MNNNSQELRKAAILLASLPEDEAVNLLSRLEPKQIEQVSIEIARLKNVSAEEQDQVITQFAQSTPGSSGFEAGGLEKAKQLIQAALGKNANAALDNLRQSIEAVPF